MPCFLDFAGFIWSFCVVVVKKSAILSRCRKYRYSLTRAWDESKPYVVFIGLNPSTADENEDDPTIRRCIAYAKSWGYGGVRMMNLFAFRATDPKKMMAADDPIGVMNCEYLKSADAFDHRNLFVAAWGNHGSFMNRYIFVKKVFRKLHYLKMNNSGQPAHPLYLKADLKPVLWE